MTESVCVIISEHLLFAVVFEVLVWYKVVVISSVMVIVPYCVKLCVTVAKAKSANHCVAKSAAFCAETL